MSPRTPAMRVGAAFFAAAFVCGAGPARGAPPAPGEFTWRAPVEAPAGSSLVRVELPAQALLLLRSRDARDLRVFNAAGEAVPYAILDPVGAAPAPRARTDSYRALPLFHAPPAAAQAKGSMQVRIDDRGGQRSVRVQLDGSDASGSGPRLDSVLFDTRQERRALAALEVQAALPANTPVRVAASSSADLAEWKALPLRGRLYRFDGEHGPANLTLEFEQTVKLEDRYLRLDWSGQAGVSVSAVKGLVAPPVQSPPRVRAELPPLQPAGPGAAELATGFATPIAALALGTPRANTLLPLRILGRNDASQPWRLLAHTVVYRLGAPGEETTSPPVALHGASVSRLRIESTQGTDLAAARLQASAEFEPVRLVFVATGGGPFELAAGRADTVPAALPVATIAATLGPRKLEDLPAAPLGPARIDPRAPGGALERLWPGAQLPGQAAVLWGVLLAGVLLLAGVAWSLLRQLKRSQPPRDQPG